MVRVVSFHTNSANANFDAPMHLISYKFPDSIDQYEVGATSKWTFSCVLSRIWQKIRIDVLLDDCFSPPLKYGSTMSSA